MYLTASQLYNYLQCSHRVWRDLYGPEEEKIKETNPFVLLLWDKGVQHEKEVISRTGGFVDLSQGTREERILKTTEAMAAGTSLIYQPVILYDNLLGIPDLLRRLDDGSYIAIDIKSGRGVEGVDEDDDNDPKLKKHYAVQLALYTEILEKLGHSNGKRQGIIYDIDHKEVLYDLNTPLGIRDQRSLWEFYEWLKVEVWNLLTNQKRNDPAMTGVCKLCPWYTSCKSWVKSTDDMTGLFYVGRSVRDTLKEDTAIVTITELKNVDIDDLIMIKNKDKTMLKGIGEKTLEKIKVRAKMMADNLPPALYQDPNLPKVAYELFFDIEDDPTQAFVYMHGVYERSPQGERFLPFVAEEVSAQAEAKAWSEFWNHIRSLPQEDFVIYYYSHHEKTVYKKLAEKYPEVATLEDIEWLFDKTRSIDLYSDVILKYTDWPVGSYSLKTIAQYLGFSWRDETPSGALSIQWYNEYLKTKDEKILQRILLYNEDDCKATMAIKDAINSML